MANFWEFVRHLILATILFIAVLAAAVGLHFTAQLLARWEIPYIVVQTTIGIKYIVFLLDVGLYLWFIFTQAVRLVRHLWFQMWE